MNEINIYGECFLLSKNKPLRIHNKICGLTTYGMIIRFNGKYFMIVKDRVSYDKINKAIVAAPIVHYEYFGERLFLSFAPDITYDISFNMDVRAQDLDTGIISKIENNTMVKFSLSDGSSYKNKINTIHKISTQPHLSLTINEQLSIQQKINSYRNPTRVLASNVSKWISGSVDPEIIAISLSLISDFTLASYLNVKNSQSDVAKIMDLLKIKLNGIQTEISKCSQTISTDQIYNRSNDLQTLCKFISDQYDRLENFVSVDLIF